DYTGVTNTLTFLPGVTNTNFSVAVTDNTIVQQNRQLNLSLFNGTPTNIASVGTNATATLTILDNDNSFSFSASNYTVNEAAGTFGISVLRFGQNTGIVSVAVSTLAITGAGAASPNIDYVDSGGTLSFSPGQSNLAFNVSIVSDLLPEGNESFGMLLTNPQPAGASLLGATNTATVTIVDDDIGIGFSAATYSVAESAGAATITILRAGVTNVSVSASFATTNGSALAGTDYIATNATFAFAAGVTSRTFTVPIINDAISESPETVNLVLSNPTGGAFLTISNAVLTILDNVGSVGFTATNFLVGESSTNGVVVVSRTVGSAGAITVQFLTAVGGTAALGLDYADVSGTLSWTNGESGSKTFLVPIFNDQLVEVTETIA
ncbi:MAG: Calx-beta domain-containing protein, partial [Bacteroidota bacterium]